MAVEQEKKKLWSMQERRKERKKTRKTHTRPIKDGRHFHFEMKRKKYVAAE